MTRPTLAVRRTAEARMGEGTSISTLAVDRDLAGADVVLLLLGHVLREVVVGLDDRVVEAAGVGIERGVDAGVLRVGGGGGGGSGGRGGVDAGVLLLLAASACGFGGAPAFGASPGADSPGRRVSALDLLADDEEADADRDDQADQLEEAALRAALLARRRSRPSCTGANGTTTAVHSGVANCNGPGGASAEESANSDESGIDAVRASCEPRGSSWRSCDRCAARRLALQGQAARAAEGAEGGRRRREARAEGARGRAPHDRAARASIARRASVSAAGKVDFVPSRVARVGPPIAGRVGTIPVVVGQKVGRGAVLVTLESVEVGRARADYLAAKTRARADEGRGRAREPPARRRRHARSAPCSSRRPSRRRRRRSSAPPRTASPRSALGASANGAERLARRAHRRHGARR